MLLIVWAACTGLAPSMFLHTPRYWPSGASASQDARMRTHPVPAPLIIQWLYVNAYAPHGHSGTCWLGSCVPHAAETMITPHLETLCLQPLELLLNGFDIQSHVGGTTGSSLLPLWPCAKGLSLPTTTALSSPRSHSRRTCPAAFTVGTTHTPRSGVCCRQQSSHLLPKT